MSNEAESQRESGLVAKLKLAGAVIIVAAAALIMFPGFLSLAAGFARIALVIVIAGAASLAVAYAIRSVVRLKNAGRQPEAKASTDFPPS